MRCSSEYWLIFLPFVWSAGFTGSVFARRPVSLAGSSVTARAVALIKSLALALVFGSTEVR